MLVWRRWAGTAAQDDLPELVDRKGEVPAPDEAVAAVSSGGTAAADMVAEGAPTSGSVGRR